MTGFGNPSRNEILIVFQLVILYSKIVKCCFHVYVRCMLTLRVTLYVGGVQLDKCCIQHSKTVYHPI